MILPLLVGLALGVLLQRSRFCTMGALSDLVLFGSRRRLRILALALALAILSTHAAALAGIVVIDGRLLFLGGHIAPPAALVGGVLFGFGMVQAGGCASRTLVRAAEGDLRSAAALLLLLVLAPLTAALLPGSGPGAAGSAALLPGPGTGGIGALRLALLPPLGWQGLAAAVLAAVLLTWWGLADPRHRAGADLGTAAGLGALAGLAWPATAAVGAAAPVPAAGLDLAIAPTALLAALTGDASPLARAPALLLGAILGAMLSARAAGEQRWRRFTDRADLRRHLVGGALMGLGAGLALGCTLAHGLSGLAVLAPSALLAVLGMAAGGRWALYLMETGQLLPHLGRR